MNDLYLKKQKKDEDDEKNKDKEKAEVKEEVKEEEYITFPIVDEREEEPLAICCKNMHPLSYSQSLEKCEVYKKGIENLYTKIKDGLPDEDS